MAVTPIDNKVSLLNTADSSRMRLEQLRQDEGQNLQAMQNIEAQDQLEQTVKGTVEATGETAINDQGHRSREHPPRHFRGEPQKPAEEELPPPSDGIRGLKLDIRG